MSNTHSAVYLSELDLSQVIANSINSAGGIVFASVQGRLGLVMAPNVKQFILEYGPPNPSVSFGHYSALAFLQQSAQLYCNRVVGAGSVYGGSVVQELSAGVTSQYNYPLANPTNFDPTQTINGSTNYLQNLLYFYAIGPGSYASNIAVAIDSQNMLQPGTVTITQPSVGQELALNNYNLAAPTQVVTTALANINPTGAQTVNGVVLATNNYILLTNQSNPSQNGVWKVNTTGAWAQIAAATTAYDTQGLNTWQLSTTQQYTWSIFQWIIAGTSVQNNDICLFNGQVNAGQNGVYQYASATGTWTLLGTQPAAIVIAGKYLFNLVSGVYVQDSTFVGSSLASGNFTYFVTAVNATGETLATMATTTVAASGSLNILSWAAVTKATSYKVYGRTAASSGLIATTTSPTFTDSGALVPNTSQKYPVSYAGTPYFTVNVYDLTVSNVNPKETFPNVTLQSSVNGYGNQTEIGFVINNGTIGSNRIQVVNPAIAYPSIPLVYSTPQMPLSGGSSGSAVLDTDIVNGWQPFTSKIDAPINMLINGGYASPTVQLAMDAIAQNRKDCFAILDTPSTQQTAAAAVNYRLNTLNLNTNYSALYTPDVLISDSYNGKQLYVPMSGYAAAQFAYADAHGGPSKAPAGLNRGILQNVQGLRVQYQDGDKDLLSDNQVNYAAKLPGSGYVLMEAWTLQSKRSALSFIPVRRILIVCETAITNALAYSLWENEDPAVFTRITSLLDDYLSAKKMANEILDYTIQANPNNNPLNDLNQGIGHVDAYVTPNLPLQRIMFRTIVLKQGVTFQEAVLLANG